MSKLAPDDLYEQLRQRLVEEGLSDERARVLASALLDGDDRATALDELSDHLDGELERLTDVLTQLDGHVTQLSASLDSAPTGTKSTPEPANGGGNGRAQRAHEHHAPHPIQAGEHEIEHLKEVAAKGESGATPAILAGRVWITVVPIVLLVIGITSGVYYAVRDNNSDKAVPWTLPNGDLSNTRLVSGSSISSENVSELGVAWTLPLTAGGNYGTFASNPVTDNGVVYLQDLASNVTAVDLESGHVLWKHEYDSQDLGPNGVTVVDGIVYGATATFPFALDAQTGYELWRNTTLVPKSKQKGGGELANGFGIDIQPQVADGRVYLSSAALLGGGYVYALDARTGKTLWSFDTVTDPLGDKIISGGAWYPPAVGDDGTVYIGTGNMYQPYSVAVSHPGKRLYTDSLLALDGETGKLKWYYQAVPNDFHDWDMHLSPVLAEADGRSLVVGGGKMGFVYAMDAASGKLVWKTKVGVHNGRDDDGTLALQGKLPKLTFPLTVAPGDVGGAETPMAVANGIVYVPVVNLPSEWKTPDSGLGGADFEAGKGEMVAIDLTDGRVVWDTKLPQMVLGAATVVNDLVFTTTFDGHLIAFDREDGSIVWNKKLPALANAPIAIDGDTVIAAAGFAGGAGQTAQVVAFQLGSKGSYASAAAAAPSTGSSDGGGSKPASAADGKSLFTQNCASCHTLAAANAAGVVGPNLDQLKPAKTAVVEKVTNGGGGMPAFGARLSHDQIDAISSYVASAAGSK